MNATRREFIASTALVATGGNGFAFPVPIRPSLFSAPPRPISDAPAPLPDGALRRLGSRRLRTGRSISRLQFSADGKCIVAADANEIRGWDVATGVAILSMAYPEKATMNSGRVTNKRSIVAFVRDEKNQYEIHHYPFATGAVETRLSTTLKTVDVAAFSAGGSRVAAIHTGRLTMLHGREPRDLWSATVGASEQRTAEIVFVLGDRFVAVSTQEGLRLFDVETGKEREALKSEPRAKKARRNTAAVDGLVASPDGKYLAAIAGANRDRILVWNLETSEVVQTFEEKDPGGIIGFLPDGKTLFVNRDGLVVALEVATKKTLRTMDLGPNRAANLSPDGTCFAIEANDSVVFFDTVAGRPLPLAADPPGLPRKLHFVGTTHLVGQLTEYGGWVQWNLATGTHRLLRPKALGEGVPLGLAADGRTALLSGKNLLRRYDFARGSELPSLPQTSTISRSIPFADISRDGLRVVAVDLLGLTVWYNGETKPVTIHPGGEGRGSVAGFDLADDGMTVATISQVDTNQNSENYLEIYSLKLGRRVGCFRMEGIVAGIKLSPDGSRLAALTGLNGDFRSSREQHHVAVYDTRNGRRIFKSSIYPNAPGCYLISRDRGLVAVASENKIDVWEVASGGLRLSFKPPGDVTAMTFCPDGTMLAAAGGGGPLLLWDLRGTLHSKPVRPDASTCGKLVEWLADANAATAFEALRLVVAWPAETLPLLASAVMPVATPNAAKITLWIEQLDSPTYRIRDKAAAELTALGELAAPPLRAAFAQTDSAEVRERVEAILGRSGNSSMDLRGLRAVEAAEWAGTDLARDVLKRWAGGAPGARLTSDAAAALHRISH